MPCTCPRPSSFRITCANFRPLARRRQRFRRRYGALRGSYSLGLSGGTWYIRPYGHGKYQYLPENAALWIAFSTWANMPPLQIQFKAVTLYEYGRDAFSELVAAQFDTIAAVAERCDALVATGVMPAGVWR